MNPSDFLGISIIGVGASLLVQFIKNQFGTQSTTTKLILVFIALVTGAGYYVLQLNQDFYQIVIQILGIASIVYAFIIKK